MDQQGNMIPIPGQSPRQTRQPENPHSVRYDVIQQLAPMGFPALQYQYQHTPPTQGVFPTQFERPFEEVVQSVEVAETGMVPYANNQMNGGMDQFVYIPSYTPQRPQENDERQNYPPLDNGRIQLANPIPQPPLPIRYPTSENMGPSFVGMIKNAEDAMLLFSAAMEGHIPRIGKRPNEEQQKQLIKPGHVIVYEHEASQIKRWTDPLHWSPSRVFHDQFLVYRELKEPKTHAGAPAKAKALKADKGARKPPRAAPYGTPAHRGAAATASHDHDLDRNLVGALVDSYDFKEGPHGMIKKTCCVIIGQKKHSLVAYYDLEYGRANWENPLSSPTEMQRHPTCPCPFKDVRVNPNLIEFVTMRAKSVSYKVDCDSLIQPQQQPQQPQQQQQQHMWQQQPQFQPQYGIQTPYQQPMPMNGYSQQEMGLPMHQQGIIQYPRLPVSQPVPPMPQQPLEQAGMPMPSFNTPQGFVPESGQPMYSPYGQQNFPDNYNRSQSLAVEEGSATPEPDLNPPAEAANVEENPLFDPDPDLADNNNRYQSLEAQQGSATPEPDLDARVSFPRSTEAADVKEEPFSDNGPYLAQFPHQNPQADQQNPERTTELRDDEWDALEHPLDFEHILEPADNREWTTEFMDDGWNDFLEREYPELAGNRLRTTELRNQGWLGISEQEQKQELEKEHFLKPAGNPEGGEVMATPRSRSRSPPRERDGNSRGRHHRQRSRFSIDPRLLTRASPSGPLSTSRGSPEDV